MASLEDVLAPHILDWMYSEGFGEVTICDEVLEAILNGLNVLENANQSDSTYKSNGRAYIKLI